MYFNKLTGEHGVLDINDAQIILRHFLHCVERHVVAAEPDLLPDSFEPRSPHSLMGCQSFEIQFDSLGDIALRVLQRLALSVTTGKHPNERDVAAFGDLLIEDRVRKCSGGLSGHRLHSILFEIRPGVSDIQDCVNSASRKLDLFLQRVG